MKLSEAKGRVGPKLDYDVTTGEFRSRNGELAKKANAMQFREYRKGFEVKEVG